MPPPDLHGNRHEDMAFAAVREHAISVALAHPLLLLKAPGASGALHVSDAPVMSSDVPRTIAELLGLRANFPGEMLVSFKENRARERRHFIYPYSRSEWTSDYLAPIQEYLVNGSVTDGDAWRLGVLLQPGGTPAG
jgi:hypothetical protein